MKTASLITGIILMILSGFGFMICLILPGITRKVSVPESDDYGARLKHSVFFFVRVGNRFRDFVNHGEEKRGAATQ